MKILLDENVPDFLKRDLSDHDVATTRDKGWTGITNGALLRLLIEEQFDALLTFDKNIQYQQNLRKYPITVIVLVTTDIHQSNLVELIPQLKALLKRPLKPGVHQVTKTVTTLKWKQKQSSLPALFAKAN
jgi:hypothetical protein